MSNPFANVDQLPEGFHKVSVVVTETELAALRFSASLEAYGTYSEAVRRAMEWPTTPYGLLAALRRRGK